MDKDGLISDSEAKDFHPQISTTESLLFEAPANHFETMNTDFETGRVSDSGGSNC